MASRLCEYYSSQTFAFSKVRSDPSALFLISAHNQFKPRGKVGNTLRKEIFTFSGGGFNISKTETETKIKIWSRAFSSQTAQRIPSVSDFNEDRIWEEKEKSVADVLPQFILVLPQFISVAEQTFCLTLYCERNTLMNNIS